MYDNFFIYLLYKSYSLISLIASSATMPFKYSEPFDVTKAPSSHVFIEVIDCIYTLSPTTYANAHRLVCEHTQAKKSTLLGPDPIHIMKRLYSSNPGEVFSFGNGVPSKNPKENQPSVLIITIEHYPLNTGVYDEVVANKRQTWAKRCNILKDSLQDLITIEGCDTIYINNDIDPVYAACLREWCPRTLNIVFYSHASDTLDPSKGVPRTFSTESNLLNELFPTRKPSLNTRCNDNSEEDDEDEFDDMPELCMTPERQSTGDLYTDQQQIDDMVFSWKSEFNTPANPKK